VSEYQYYEFVALDKPLTEQQRAELRELSSRAREYCDTEVASVIETGDHVIIRLYLDREPDDDWIDADGLLASMVQARSDLAAGDLRLLYLGWLLRTQWADEYDEDTEDDEDTEPPVPAGLGELSAPRVWLCWQGSRRATVPRCAPC
jgi:hypothetical protein